MKILSSIITFFLVFYTISFVFAQTNESQVVVEHKISPLTNYYQGDSPNSPRHKYHVLNYQINLDIRNCFISPYTHAFTGYVIVKFVIDTALNQITLNASNQSIQVTSVGLSGVSFTQINDILTVNLDRTYNVAETAFVKINYNHLNIYDTTFYAANGTVLTDCEPLKARHWLPCWDDPADKATTDIIVKGPAAAKIGSNGRLNDSTVTGDTIYYHWISGDPVATYLITIIGNINFYNDIMYWHKLSNPLDSIPITFYYIRGDNPTPVKNVIIDMTNYYSILFGEYPFEKIGMTSISPDVFPGCGGMENQTLINFFCHPIWDVGLTSHEFAHQWFGDMITCGTWGDIWLNEGFATYCEALWIEHTNGYAAYHTRIVNDASGYLNNPIGYPIYNPPPNEWFNEALTYDKAACVLHMLRYVLGDSIFFACLKAYATDTNNFKYKTSVTDDFVAKVSKVAGRDITWFFNEWVKQPYHPVYANTYSFAQAGSNWNAIFRAYQSQTNSPFHTMPILLDFQFASGPDSLVTVMNNSNGQLFYWTFNRQPIQVTFDPNDDIVLKQGNTVFGLHKESEKVFKFSLSQNYPNPFNPSTKIKFSIPDTPLLRGVDVPSIRDGRGVLAVLKIYDILGREITTLVNSKLQPGTYEVEWDATNYPSGVYFYKLQAGDFVQSKKMILLK